MKKISALIFTLLSLTFLLAACGKADSTKMTIDGIVIKEGVYNYYADEAKKETDIEEERYEIALQKCKEFAAAQLLLSENELSVRPYFKRRTAEDTESIWSMFGAYYSENGITKQDINAVTFHEYSKKELLHYHYGTEGLNPVSVMDLKEAFVDLYVGFKAIEGSLTKENNMGETVSLSEAETTALEKEFSSMASSINNKTATIDELNEKYSNSLGLIVTDTLPIILAKKDDGLYDDEFFQKVTDIPHGFARVVKSGSSIYVVERAVIATSDEDAFTEYSSEVLETVKMGSIDKMIKKRAEKCKVEY